MQSFTWEICQKLLPLNPNETTGTMIIRSGINNTLSMINVSALCYRQPEWLKRWVKWRSQRLVRSRPIRIKIQRSPTFGTMSLFQKLEFFIAFLHAVYMNSFVAFGTTWIWIHRHDFLLKISISKIGTSFRMYCFQLTEIMYCFDLTEENNYIKVWPTKVR